MLKICGVFFFLVDIFYLEKEFFNFIFIKYSIDIKLIFLIVFKVWKLLFFFFLLKIIKVYCLF